MQGKIALVTGATDGIGKATAKKLLTEGWRVVIVGRNPQRCAATIAELKSLGAISAITADLTSMRETNRAVETFLRENQSLDCLLLNANAIVHEHIVTPEGFEANFALGYLSRALTTFKLEPILQATPHAHILTVIGMNAIKVDFDDLTIAKKFSGWLGLGRWQWATQVFANQFNATSAVPMNVYMPGLVRTKILANEPQPMRLVVQIANLVMGIPVEKSAENIFNVMNDVTQNKRKGAHYKWDKLKPALKLEMNPDDPQKLWDVTRKILAPYL
ncbi:MAG: SDR family NAD(P)-dependent oxidoreductase [Chloroflexi bacterium]|nr:SDR family NAD(P)-dependent oxidoreductase [Chloroflexota bacterium]